MRICIWVRTISLRAPEQGRVRGAVEGLRAETGRDVGQWPLFDMDGTTSDLLAGQRRRTTYKHFGPSSTS